MGAGGSWKKLFGYIAVCSKYRKACFLSFLAVKIIQGIDAPLLSHHILLGPNPCGHVPRLKCNVLKKGHNFCNSNALRTALLTCITSGA